MTRKIDKLQTVSYRGHAFQLEETRVFSDWLGSLRDRRARAKVVDRLTRMSNGNFGVHKSVGGGVFEMKIDYGPGYRAYYFQRGREIVILLCGGDKRTQDADVAYAKRLKEEIENRDGDKAV